MIKGIKILSDIEGNGDPIERGNYYTISTKIWLSRGDSITWNRPSGLYDNGSISEDKTELISDYRIDREYLIAGIFYGIEGMKIGGTRKIKVPPHLAYKETGVPNMIPPNAVLTIEIKIIKKRQV